MEFKLSTTEDIDERVKITNQYWKTVQTEFLDEARNSNTVYLKLLDYDEDWKKLILTNKRPRIEEEPIDEEVS